MARSRATFPLLLICLISLALSSCIVERRRLIVRKGGGTAQALRTADSNTLLGLITTQYNAIQTLNATVDMVPARGSAEKSVITEYKEIRAFVLFRKPADIRIVGLVPVVRNRAFDMVSDGREFKLYIPTRNRFIVGANSIDTPSTNTLENLRPQHFVDALLVRPIDLQTSRVMLENFTDVDNAFYILYEVHDQGAGQLVLSRAIWFNRLDLRISRQLIFDAKGNILTDARYTEWRSWDNNVPFPKHIEINRPRDEYSVVIDIVKMDINGSLTDAKFVLEQPAGSVLQVLGQAPAGKKP